MKTLFKTAPLVSIAALKIPIIYVYSYVISCHNKPYFLSDVAPSDPFPSC